MKGTRKKVPKGSIGVEQKSSKRSRDSKRPRRDDYDYSMYRQPASNFVVRNKGEKFAVDMVRQQNTFLATPTGVLLNPIAPGNGPWNRRGDSVILRSLYLTFRIYLIQRAANIGNQGIFGDYCRIIVIYDANPNGAAIPALTDIFQTVPQSGTANTTDASFLQSNIVKRNRYQIVMDERYALPVTICAGSVGSEYSQNVNTITEDLSGNRYLKNIRGKPMVFGGTSAVCTNADIVTGSLYLYTVGLSNATTGTSAAMYGLDWSSRVRFDDPNA